MKLRTRLSLSIIIIVFITMAVIAYGMQRAYSDSFFNYLENEEETRLKRIVNDIGTIARTESLDLTKDGANEQLQLYARDANINITIMDTESTILANYRGLVENAEADIQVDQYQLVDSHGEKRGTMLVTYDRSSPALRNALHDFQRRSLNSTMLGIVVFGLIAIVFSYFFSKQITEPIESLRSAADRIRQNEFDITLDDSPFDELQSLNANMQYLASSLRQQEDARRSYAQDISHELRTPLTNMQLHVEAMKDGIIPSDKKNWEQIEANITQLTLLVERLKNTFREASLVAAEEIRFIDCSALTERVIDSFEPRIVQKNGAFVRAIDPAISLQTDERLFSQILSNLLSNAIKAIEEGGQIRVALNADRKYVVLTVTDNGVGIAQNNLAHLFDRFYRVDSSRNRAAGGQGLGLSITRNIVQQLGGHIEVTSKVGKGTTFRVRLPDEFFRPLGAQ
ncbi:HAMP domain-containing sensor histidine kinase [uncultured Murdochiella sp.]|uniref:sensor histidine kinase n=1 Tax=uncultured Murdochiella sp. TaxID=1586095 RepID=UPI002804BCF0|nr:HAMP domain-containing sensor histidine kinase [uncultured Murdochiella sp.]